MNKEGLIEKLLFLCAASAILIVFFIVAFIAKEGLPAIFELGTDFFFGMRWRPLAKFEEPSFGILPMVISTFIIGAGALIIATALGIPCAIFLAEYAPAWIRNIVKPSIEMLVGIPSVVLGFFGLMLLCSLIRSHLGGYGVCVLAGWIILAIMTLPHVISISEDAIRAVPKGYKEASLALGSTKWQSIHRVILPSAKSGILASIVLGMGNAIGETMAVLMVIGNPEVPDIPSSILEPVRVLTSTIIIDMDYMVWGSLHEHSVFAIGLVLFIVVAILNLVATVVLKGRLRR
jgi:phosphate transport system permease protein